VLLVLDTDADLVTVWERAGLREVTEAVRVAVADTRELRLPAAVLLPRAERVPARLPVPDLV